ncbi:MAG: DDE-type integrase/transposase/recombinase [Candidatus Thiodiazotropha sp. (ex Ctena orbiculata)]|nr:DDE-type integrase/transposase/recombinase [Candidatus Thiodiazotropha taylori]
MNNLTVKDTFPLPIIEDCLDTLAGNVWFSKLDANSAYWQVLINPKDRKKTAFLTKYGLYEHVRMGFGMTNSPATFSRMINLILRGLTWKTVLAFLDDILVLGMDFEDHFKNLAEAFKRFKQHGLKLKARKCVLFQREVEFLGRVVSSNQLKMAAKDITTVADWPVPKSSKDVEKFLGLANYHRSFIKNFAELARVLYALTGKNKFKWGNEEEEAFEALKKALTSPPVLGLPNSRDPFLLDTDASDSAIGGELIQVQNGEEKVIAYSSFVLTPEQKKYCTTRKELLSIVRFTRQFRHYLLGRIFTVRTDHSSLTWLLKFKDPQGQLARWMEELSQYHMVVQHRPGTKHGNADALSRKPDDLTFCPSFVAGIKPTDLPCGGCHYCVRADQQWGTFLRDVDEAVSLTNTTPKTVSKVTMESEIVDINNPSGQTVMLEAAGLRVSGYRSKESSGSVLPFSPEQNCREANTDEQDFITMLADVDTEDSIGLSDAHLDIVREDKDQFHVCACTVSIAEATSDQPSCWGFTFEELEKEQAEDKDLKAIMAWLSTKEEPDEGSLFISSPEAKYYWVNKEIFQLIDGVLFRHNPKSKVLELVVPESLKEKAIELHHDIPSSAHQGIARTKAKLKEKFFWVRLSRDVESYVLSCAVCSQNKKNKCYGKVPLTEYQAGAPMERVHIDFIGPLPKTERGNEHCLMMVDQFTKWVECIPLPSQKAEVTARGAVDEFFSRFGFPFQLFSDQGRNFESKLFEALCKILEIHKTRTTPYRPSANGQVERFNRTLMDAVRCFLHKSQNKWDQWVQQIAGAIRSSVNRSTGFTPNMLMLGREVNTPAQLMFPCVKEKYEDYGEYVSGLMENMKKAHDCARSNLKTSFKRMKRYYDLRVLQRQYAEGDIIYLLDTATVKGKSRKLTAPWKGPAVIVKKLSAYLYRVKLRNAVFIVNHDRMMPSKDRKVPDWITKYRRSKETEDDQDEEDDQKQYCVCRKPYSGQFMIQCDFCEEWYHGSCVNITPTDALGIDRYKCKACKDTRS